jgi:hypothetical protein
MIDKNLQVNNKAPQNMKKQLIIATILALSAASCGKDPPKQPTDISNQYTVSTLAGNGTKGSVDGPAASAQFNSPQSIAVDGLGNVYVADPGKYRIRKISKDGMVSTLAGGSRGAADGTGIGAEFINPAFVTVDQQNNVYVSDSTRIRKITSSGDVTTVAGRLEAGYLDGSGANAQFIGLGRIAADKNGNIYALDNGSFTASIRKITSSGIVTTFIDSTQKFGNSFGLLWFISTDPSGNIFVYGGGILASYLFKITPSKSISQFATIPAISGLTIAPMTGDIYITGWQFCFCGGPDYNTIYKVVSSEPVYIAVAGSKPGFAEGAGNIAQFLDPSGLAADGQGNIYVADMGNNRIRKISKK